VFGAVPSSHFGGIGLDLMRAPLAPDDQPDAGGSIAERHRRAAIGFRRDRAIERDLRFINGQPARLPTRAYVSRLALMGTATTWALIVAVALRSRDNVF
jgi:hypothetical protein